jgi:hypothetical protein
VDYYREMKVERGARCYLRMSRKARTIALWRRKLQCRGILRGAFTFLNHWAEWQTLRLSWRHWRVAVGPAVTVAASLMLRFSLERWVALAVARRKRKAVLARWALQSWRRLLWLRGVTNTALRSFRAAYVILATR